jgi:hypothetical protein
MAVAPAAVRGRAEEPPPVWARPPPGAGVADGVAERDAVGEGAAAGVALVAVTV